LAILLVSCESKFRGRRKITGGYTYYDSRQYHHFDIAGPNPTPSELAHIEKQYSAYVAAQAELERAGQEELEKREIEEARLLAIRRVEAQRQAAAAQAEAQRQAAAAQMALAALQKRQQAASRNVLITSSSVECRYGPSTCGIYKFAIGLRNESGEAISALSFGWAFMPDKETQCPTSLPTKRREEIRLSPSDTTVINIDGHDGPGSSNFRYCIRVTGAEIVSQR
jgi:hypothetical protein